MAGEAAEVRLRRICLERPREAELRVQVLVVDREQREPEREPATSRANGRYRRTTP